MLILEVWFQKCFFHEMKDFTRTFNFGLQYIALTFRIRVLKFEVHIMPVMKCNSERTPENILTSTTVLPLDVPFQVVIASVRAKKSR